MTRPLTEIDRIIQSQRERAERETEPREVGAVPQAVGIETVRMRVKSIGNDTLTCRTWDGSTEGGTDISVAKPPELRHDAGWYAGLTSLATVDAQTVTAGDGATSETWKVTPDYVVDVTEIWAMQGSSGVDDVNWMDVNVAGRAWAVA